MSNWVISVPVWSKAYVNIFIERSIPAIKHALHGFANKHRVRFIIHTDEPERIGEALARKEGARALVTGESLGQVASQTLENMTVIEEAADIPVFRPLIGLDKQEIVDLAKKIGTYRISIQAYQDCCTFMVPKHPVTRARLGDVKKLESRLDMDKMLGKVKLK